MSGNNGKKTNTFKLLVAGGIVVAAILVLGTIRITSSAGQDTEKAVHQVSLLYLDELADRREQVIEANLKGRIRDLQTAISLMTEESISDIPQMQAYQTRMKELYSLEKFAFVDEDGIIYSSKGTQDNFEEYKFNHKTIFQPEISILDTDAEDKKVIIAVPVKGISVGDINFTVCFMEIDMDAMLEGVSMFSNSGTTICSIYTKEGEPLDNAVLGGRAVENNLFEALRNAEFEEGYSYERIENDFKRGTGNEVSFIYNGISDTMHYVPIEGTDWFLTYLIRESSISESISNISNGIIVKSMLQSGIAALLLIGIFIIIAVQMRRNARFELEKEKTEAENRVKQEEMEDRIALQEKMLEHEKRRTQQDNMITAMAADYRAVYYVNLDEDEGICYRADPADKDQTPEGERFSYCERFRRYAKNNVDEAYKEGFLDFINPDNIRERLLTETILSYRYLASRAGKEYYEMIRVAGVRHIEDRIDHKVHAIGLGLTVIDSEMRENMAQQQALRDALAAAEQASKAKTMFLSNMSHEIRTPMNAIIGLDNIALNEPDLSPKTRDYLVKIGDSAEHLLSLINDVLDMSRIESGKTVLKNEGFSFRKMIEYVNTMFSDQCAENHLEYNCNIKGQVDEYYIGDSMKLRQVLINLLGNSVKFTSEGSISLDIERTAHFNGKSTLRFTISDTGAGISKEYLPHIFESFSQEDSSATNKYGSSGLGLAITKNIVELMNGDITVESEKGVGTTFTVTVTLLDAEKKEKAVETDTVTDKEAKEKKAVLDGRRILLAEDIDVNAEIIMMVLEMRGIEADRAENGRVAVEKFASHEAGYYSAILMDMRMPEMDGLEATGAIRAMDRADAKDVPIIALTANAFDEDVQRSLQAGLNAHLCKPVNPDELFKTLEMLITD